MTDHAKLKARLEAERDDLREKLAMSQPEYADDISPGMGNHPAEVANQVFEQAKTLTQQQLLGQALEDTIRAIEKIDEGRYGVCEACGRPINPERLEALPTVQFCLDDQMRTERELRVEDVREADDLRAAENESLRRAGL